MEDTIIRVEERSSPLTVDLEDMIGFGSGGVSPGDEMLHEMCSHTKITDSNERVAAFLATNGLEEKTLITKDIRGRLKHGWRSRDQYARGTCTAFAAVAAVELLVSRKNKKKQRLSPEFVYWNMRYNPDYMLERNISLDGTKLSQASGVMCELGVPEETHYPYPRQDPGFKNKPSNVMNAQALVNRVKQAVYWDIIDHGCPATPTVLTIYKELAKGRPVCIGVPVFKYANRYKDNWKNRASVDTGIVYGPTDKSDADIKYKKSSAHVVTIVGFQPDSQQNGGGWFIFKNSWGTQFGKYPRAAGQHVPIIPTIGFGAISAQYVETFCWELLSLKLAADIID